MVGQIILAVLALIVLGTIIYVAENRREAREALPPESRPKELWDRYPWLYGLISACIGVVLIWTDVLQQAGLPFQIPAQYLHILGFVFLAASPVGFFAGLPKSPKFQFDYDDTSAPTTTKAMERKLLEELVRLNQKQLYWIRITGIFYVLGLLGSILYTLTQHH